MHKVENGASAAAFTLLFEVCSAFGNVGLSLGYDYQVRDALHLWGRVRALRLQPSPCTPTLPMHDLAMHTSEGGSLRTQ